MSVSSVCFIFLWETNVTFNVSQIIGKFTRPCRSSGGWDDCRRTLKEEVEERTLADVRLADDGQVNSLAKTFSDARVRQVTIEFVTQFNDILPDLIGMYQYCTIFESIIFWFNNSKRVLHDKCSSDLYHHAPSVINKTVKIMIYSYILLSISRNKYFKVRYFAKLLKWWSNLLQYIVLDLLRFGEVDVSWNIKIKFY
jgi:hypothetical protein